MINKWKQNKKNNARKLFENYVYAMVVCTTRIPNEMAAIVINTAKEKLTISGNIINKKKRYFKKMKN
jgi:hypothetical protein